MAAGHIHGTTLTNQVSMTPRELADRIFQSEDFSDTSATAISLLRAKAGNKSGSIAFLPDLSTAGDRRGGQFRWDAASTDNDDAALIIKPDSITAANPGRWINTGFDLSIRQATAEGGNTRRSLAAKMGETVSVRDFGAVGDGTTNDLPAFQAAVTAAGVNGVVYIPYSDQPYHLDSAWEVGTRGITIKSDGASIDNTLVKEAVKVCVQGQLNIDFSNITGTRPWWGVVYHRGGDGAYDDLIYVDGAPCGAVLGGSRGGQVVGLRSRIVTERCGIAATISASGTGVAVYQLSSLGGTITTLDSGGGGYPDGQWVGRPTSSNAAARGAVLGVTVVGGVVTDYAILDGGTLNAVGNTWTITNTEFYDRDDNQMAAGGTGFQITINELYTTTLNGWFNDNDIEVGLREAYRAGFMMWGANYNTIRCYMEAVSTYGDPYLWGQCTSHYFKHPVILVNGALNSPGANARLIDFGADFGTTRSLSFVGGRVANSQETFDPATYEKPVDHLFNKPDSNIFIANTEFVVGTGGTARSTFGETEASNLIATNLYQRGLKSRMNNAIITMTNGGTVGHTMSINLGAPLVAEGLVYGRAVMVARRATGNGTFNELYSFEIDFLASINLADTLQHVEASVVSSIRTSNHVATITAAGVVVITFDTAEALTSVNQFLVAECLAHDVFNNTDPRLWT